MGEIREILLYNIIVKKWNSQLTTDQFANRDIGNPCASGRAVITNNGFTITAGGDDIYNNQDQFHMVYRKLKGDDKL